MPEKIGRINRSNLHIAGPGDLPAPEKIHSDEFDKLEGIINSGVIVDLNAALKNGEIDNIEYNVLAGMFFSKLIPRLVRAEKDLENIEARLVNSEINLEAARFEIEDYRVEAVSVKSELEATKTEIEKLKRLVTLDSLTEILNRRGFDKEFAEAKERFKNNKKIDEKREFNSGNILVFIIDVDNFKLINDLFGHSEGDKALKLVASLLQNQAIGRGGKVARIGGDEFAILQESKKSLTVDEVRVISLRIQEKINPLLFALDESGKEFGFTISVGGSVSNNDEDKTFDQLKEEADTAMYKAKNH